MEMVPTHGKMVDHMLENITMIRNKDLVSIHGLMDVNMRGSGRMVNNTVQDNIY
jgi:hypothetical protein